MKTGSKTAISPSDARGITWREFFRGMIGVAGCGAALISVVFLIMVMNERYGIIPALLTLIIVLMIFPKDKGIII
jgi:hypothetical protein